MPLWFKRRPYVPLPPNIHTAPLSSPQASSESSADAEADKIPPTEKPLFYQAAERIALQRGISPAKLLQDYDRRLHESTYPTEDCLTPDEVQDHSGGKKLTESQKKHVADCAGCGNLLDALLHDDTPTPLPKPVEDAAAAAALAKAALAELRTVVAASAGTGDAGFGGTVSTAVTARASATPQIGQPPPPGPIVGWGVTVKYHQLPLSAKAAVVGGTVAALAAAIYFGVPLAAVFFHKPRVSEVKTKVVILPHAEGFGSKPVALGTAEDVNRRLGAVKGLDVIGPSSAMAFEDENMTPSEIASKLGVHSTRPPQTDSSYENPAAPQFRIVEVSATPVSYGRTRHDTHEFEFQLVNVSANGARLQNVTLYEGRGDALQASSEMALAVVNAFGVKLSPSEDARLSETMPASPSVSFSNSYMFGRYLLSTRTLKHIEESRGIFDKLVKERPDFALAYASLADSYNLLAIYEAMPTRDAYKKAKENVDKALGSDPGLANAYAARALTHLYGDKIDWGKAEEDLEYAIELDSSYAEAHQWYGLLLSVLRRPRAIEELRRAAELEPFPAASIESAVGDGYFLDAKFSRAIEVYRKILDKAKAQNAYKEEKYNLTKANLASAYLAMSECKEARDILEDVPPPKKYIAVDIAYERALCGEKDEARRRLLNLEDAFDRAQVFTALGETDKAFEALDEAYKERAFRLFQLPADPAFSPLHHDPRFRKLMRRINYPGIGW